MVNKLATVGVDAAAKSRADRTKDFHEIFEQPASYTPMELVNMVFADPGEGFTPGELELIQVQIEILARFDHDSLAKFAAGALVKTMMLRSIFANFLHATYHHDKVAFKKLEALEASEKLSGLYEAMANLLSDELRVRFQSAVDRAKAAADARHNKAGGSREKQAAIRSIWATGKYSSRDRCAEEEGGSLGMSFSAARRALRNIPRET